MSVWHGDMHKRKLSSGKSRANRKKRRFETGSFPAETIRGDPKQKVLRGRGANVKHKLLAAKFVCVTDTKTGKTEKVEITRVARNPANIDYDRRGVITKGALVETSLGIARVTSRPGQDGTLNAILVGSKTSG